MGDRAHAACEALTRVLDIEQGLMNETYLEAALARAKRVEEEQRQISLRGMELLGRRYVDAVELAGAILIGLDPQGLIQIFNREAQRVTGYTRDEVSGKSFVEMFVVDRQPFDDAWAAAEQGGTVDLSFALKSRAHRVREIAAELTMGAGLPDADVIHILAGQDVTHERAMAAQLRQSERLAAVGTLAAGLAHEIRNPLNGAQLHLTYLRRAIERQKLNGDLSETVDVVVDEVKRLSTLVSEFLSFARPGEIVRKPAVMQEIAKRSFSLVASRDKDVELSLQVPDSDITAEVDPGRIEQVILNLLTNAVDAACGGVGSKVVLRLLREPRSCVIEVEDDGPGLPSPDAPIFDAFYSTKAGGTGLGLAIVHRIVTDHDGVIEVKSGPGRTLFRVRLPLEASGRADSTPLPPPVLERKS
jgi:PAS domain S-box-containing protein